MTVREIARKLKFSILTENNGLSREITRIYCCDLLSLAMSKAPVDCAWVTVMGNVNVIAVAYLADVSCVVLAEGAILDKAAFEKANEHNIPVLAADSPVFESAKAIFDLIGSV